MIQELREILKGGYVWGLYLFALFLIFTKVDMALLADFLVKQILDPLWWVQAI